MLSFECIKNEKSVYFLLTSALLCLIGQKITFIFYLPRHLLFFHFCTHFLSTDNLNKCEIRDVIPVRSPLTKQFICNFTTPLWLCEPHSSNDSSCSKSRKEKFR